MAGKRIYNKKLSDQVLIRVTPDQMARIEYLRQLTGAGTAQILRDALDHYFEGQVFAPSPAADLRKAEVTSEKPPKP